MKNIEKRITPLIESQFPSFYQEEGENFIAFVKAYYEWMENAGTYTTYSGSTVTQYIAPNNHIIEVSSARLANAEYMASIASYIPIDESPLYHARRLPDYRDIDTTTDEFIVHFKEKYLKNIQFDTATNKKLLVKNSLDLYRSKGTEQSIDLFFKLVYGTSAEVQYPAEKIFRLSDGVYEKPEYLEIGYSIYNIDYVGKEVVGQLSGAKAFVEKYIRRRAGKGYVNLLYISGRQGEFRNGEVIGLNVNNQPVFDISKRSKLVGSVKRVTVQTRGRDFAVGDIVKFVNSDRGIGGFARVEAINSQSGLVDFIFEDGGYGYTLNAESIVSEKVLNLDYVVADYTSEQYYKLFERGIQPVINIGYSAITSNVGVGNTVYRYASNGQLAAEGRVLEVAPSSNTNGYISVSHTAGVFVPNAAYGTSGNTITFTAQTIEDKSMSGKFMNTPTDYNVTITAPSATFNVGDVVMQVNNQAAIGTATIANVVVVEDGTVLTVTNARGVFKNSKRMADWDYKAGTGTITTSNTSNVVTGTSTSFSNNYLNATLYDDGNVAIGNVSSVVNSTSLTLSTNAAVSVTGNTHSYGLTYRIMNQSNTAVFANVSHVTLNAGLYDIKKQVHIIQFEACSSNNVTFANNLYVYNVSGNLVSEGQVITVDYDASTNTGNLTFISRKGYWNETDTVYTTANADNFRIVTYSLDIEGGDYVRSYPARIIAPASNTTANLTSISYGTGASFGVGTISESEVIFIGTDLISANSQDTLDYSRLQLSIASNTGFLEGQRVYQQIRKSSFNPSTAVNAATGFITLTNANTYYIAGDQVTYEVAAGNTVVTGLESGKTYHVVFSNTTGLILSQTANKYVHINSTSYPGETFSNTSFNIPAFAATRANETGHFLYKTAHGTVYDVAGGVIRVKDPIRDFGYTNNTSTPANGNIIVYGNTAVNTAITAVTELATLTQANQVFASETITSDAYGFPKNPEGNFLDNLYACLTFGRFEIGIIGSLNQVNPGEDYNVDPFVLAYQPYISAFDRKDLVISYENATRNFAVGEIVNQTQANLKFYDLKVSSGAYSNTYDAKTFTVQTQYEVNSAADFIYYRGISTTFNATDEVNSNTDFITITGNEYAANDLVRYFTDTGNTALTGLSNNSYYYVLTSNSTGITLTTEAGNTAAKVNVTQSSNIASFNSNTNVQNSNDFIQIASANSLFANGDQVRYVVTSGITPVTGLTNGSLYYVRYANSTGLALSATASGANIDITALAPGDDGHFLRYYNADMEGHNLRSYTNEFANGQIVQYRIPTGNTAISGLTANATYYVVGSNTVGFKLSSTSGGSAINITANSTGGESHTVSTLPGYLPKDRVFQNVGGSVVNATVSSIFSNTTGDYVRITANTAAITNNDILYSYTVPTANGLISSVSLFEIVSTAKAIVKSSNATHVLAKRITFENTWQSGGTMIGEVTGTEADVIGVTEDNTELYPIGLNADLTANVITADGEVSSLQVIDSGFAYANAEIVDFVSEDNLRAGTAKIILDGHGIGKGYYRSSKGFLSDDIYVHDGDYYQEYSYEILSKISVDRYADMFKKVMHLAGSKFFGSALIVEEANAVVSVANVSTGQQVQFNSVDDVSTVNDTIQTDIEDVQYTFKIMDVNSDTDFISLTVNPYYNRQLYNVHDYLQYTTTESQTIGVGSSSSLTNTSYYYVVFANTTGIKISETRGGDALNLNTAAISNTLELHTFTRVINPFANGDIVRYTTSNTAVEANATLTFVTNTISSNTISVSNNVFRIGDVVKYTKNGGSAAVGLTAGSEYFVRKANSTSIMLANSIGKAVSIYSNSTVETHVLRIEKLANNQTYYVVNTTPNTVKLSLTANGSPINITANGSTSGSATAGHFLTKTVEE